MTSRGARALREACRISAQMRELREHTQSRTAALARRRRRLWLKANREGATFVTIRTTCDVSASLVEQEIRRARAEEQQDG